MSAENDPDLLNRFQHHPPSSAIVARHELAREACWKAAVVVKTLTPPSREQSLAITALEEAMMWANAAIARHDEDGNRKDA